MAGARPRLLDLFCGAGGCSAGYERAGFDVTGVDINPMPRYPFTFHQADAMTFDLDGYDVIHASPPCQKYSVSTVMHDKSQYPDLLDPIRDRLVASGVPWVIENVPGAPMRNYVQLCGSGFGMVRLRRHDHGQGRTCGVRANETGGVTVAARISLKECRRCGVLLTRAEKKAFRELGTDEQEDVGCADCMNVRGWIHPLYQEAI